MLKIDTTDSDRPVVIDGYEYATPRSPWRVLTVEPLENYRLRVTFRDGISGEVDMSGLMAREDSGVFRTLRDPRDFRGVGVVFGAVTWPNGVDLAPDAMHDDIERNGVCILR